MFLDDLEKADPMILTLSIILPEIAIYSHEDLLKGLYNMKFAKPSKIQERALPLLLQNPYVHRKKALLAQDRQSLTLSAMTKQSAKMG